MDDTSVSLLYRVTHENDSESWNRMAELYTPLLRCWAERYNVQKADVDDLIQEVLLAMSRDLESFEHNGRVGAFRTWLKTVLIHRLKNAWRTRNRQPAAGQASWIESRLAELEDPSSQLSQQWDQEHDRFVLKQLLRQTEPNFSESTWAAFHRVAIEGQPADLVARDLELSLNAVFIAKSRVLRRLREEAAGLVDSAVGILPKS